MHHQDAVEALQRVRQGKQRSVRFVSPIVSTMMAAETLRGGSLEWVQNLNFGAAAGSYASTAGLTDVLDGGYQFPSGGGAQGRAYSKLTKLATHDEVEACNRIVNDLIHHQLHEFSPEISRALSKVVGELHDNVASHASGAGFSAVQVYNDRGSRPRRRVEFAIADAGFGMRHNVQRVVPAISTDHAAIEWCLDRGNTTAITRDDMAQRLPDDAFGSPFPDSVGVYSDENHHIGEGLWRLMQLVQGVEGTLWIRSGHGCFLLRNGTESCLSDGFCWNGVAIEVELLVPEGATISSEREEKVAKLGERLGL